MFLINNHVYSKCRVLNVFDRLLFNSSGAEAQMFQEDKVNIIAADALAPSTVRSSAALSI